MTVLRSMEARIVLELFCETTVTRISMYTYRQLVLLFELFLTSPVIS